MSQQAFTREDLDLMREKGIPPEAIESQLQNFRKGFPPISLVAPAIAGNGINRLSDVAVRNYALSYENKQGHYHILKFIPASGAATRMFKSFFEYLNQDNGSSGQGEPGPEIMEIVVGLDKLALKEDLEEVLRLRGKDLEAMAAAGETREIVRVILEEDGLNYGQLAKGLLRFHRYARESRTPVEEHMVEGAEYCRGEGGQVNLHFTVSPEHLDHFKKLVEQKQPDYEKSYGVRYDIGFSLQRPYTDTIAVDPENNPFRDPDGQLVFRPGGHGALLVNLHEMDADLIFIKNIDNVCPDRMKALTTLYKKALAGVLLECRERTHRYLRLLDEGDHSELEQMEKFLETRLCTRLSDKDKALPGKDKAGILKQKLNRPIRVCGMVLNEGEPGGGPFWAKNRDGSVSLQIVEPPQIDFSDEKQAGIAREATHFNPVDLVCTTKDYLGQSFSLPQYIDPDTGFISRKSRDGRSLKAMELPGLWNGSMSDWNTVFIEVPIETFNPVKTINDLLRPQHLE